MFAIIISIISTIFGIVFGIKRGGDPRPSRRRVAHHGLPPHTPRSTKREPFADAFGNDTIEYLKIINYY